MSQQLVKKGANGRIINVNPRSWIEAIKDKNTGQSLLEILQGFNMYFLSYNGDIEETRNMVPTNLRKKGLWITYVKYDGNVYTEWYASSKIDDKSWGDSSNWRIGNNTLVGDITISANGNWVINGTETEFKAVGEKGNTPLIRVANNRLQVSYDLGDTYTNVTENPVYTQFRNHNNKIQISTDLGATWTDASDEIAAYFRWQATSGDTQANNVGRVQISRDNKTWVNLSNDIVNNLHISRYIGVNESLPTSGIAEGTIYAKGPYYAEDDTLNDNPIYRLWVYAWKDNTLAWQDNGEFTSIAAGVVQETGDSETEVMSQKAVTEKLSELGSEVYQNYLIGDDNNYVSNKVEGLIPGHKYELTLKHETWDITNVSVGGTPLMFSIQNYYNEAKTEDFCNVLISKGRAKKQYTFILPSESDYLLIGGRANKGVKVWYTIIDITNAESNKEEILKGVLTGNDNEFVSNRHRLSTTYSLYRIKLSKGVWDTNGITLDETLEYKRFSVSVTLEDGSNINIASKALVNTTDNLKCYDFKIPSNTDFVTVGFRANKGEVLSYSIEDISNNISSIGLESTFDVSKSANVSSSTNAIYTNIEQDEDFCIKMLNEETFVPNYVVSVFVSYKDETEAVSLGSFNHFARFKAEKQIDKIGLFIDKKYVANDSLCTFIVAKGSKMELLGKYEEAEIDKSFLYNRTISFIGNGKEFSEGETYNVIGSNTYRVILKNKDWNRTGVPTSGSYQLLNISVLDSSDNVLSSVTANVTSVIEDYYEIYAPINSSKLRISGRAANKEVVEAEVVNVSALKDTYNVKTNSITVRKGSATSSTKTQITVHIKKGQQFKIEVIDEYSLVNSVGAPFVRYEGSESSVPLDRVYSNHIYKAEDNIESIGLYYDKANGDGVVSYRVITGELYGVETNEHPAYKRNISNQNQMVAASRASSDFQFLIGTDIHSKWNRLNNAVEITNNFQTCNSLIVLGDIVDDNMYDRLGNQGFWESIDYLRKPFLLSVGNHDVGNAYFVDYCLNHEEVYSCWIEPLLNKGILIEGEYQEGKNYYYHDIADKKVRVICLYEYDEVIELDNTYWEETDYDNSSPEIAANTTYVQGSKVSLKNYEKTFVAKQSVTTGTGLGGVYGKLVTPSYKVQRGKRVLGYEQAVWLANTLASTPENYNVIIALHGCFTQNAFKYKDSKFTDTHGYIADSSYGPTPNLMDTDFIADIVEAYSNKTIYSAKVRMKGEAEYMNIIADSGGNYAYSIEKDFSTSKGKFLCYIGGHYHQDIIWKHNVYNQYQVCPICMRLNNTVDVDIKRTDDNSISDDSLTVVSAETNKIKLVKLGQNITVDGVIRDMEVLKTDI